MHEEIINWFTNQCDYASGVELYQKYGKDMRLKRFVFLPGNNNLAMKARLKNELGKLAEIDPDKWKPEAKKTVVPQPDQAKAKKIQMLINPAQSLKISFPKIDYSKLPDVLKILTMDRISLYHKANAARRNWFNAKSDEERYQINSEEISCRRQNVMIWAELNHFEKTGEILGKHPRFRWDRLFNELKAKSKKQLFTMLTNMPSYRSKVKSALASLTDEADIARKMTLLEKYDEKEQIIRKLLEL